MVGVLVVAPKLGLVKQFTHDREQGLATLTWLSLIFLIVYTLARRNRNRRPSQVPQIVQLPSGSLVTIYKQDGPHR